MHPVAQRLVATTWPVTSQSNSMRMALESARWFYQPFERAVIRFQPGC